jgi:two-component system, NtrC family, sensor kinase
LRLGTKLTIYLSLIIILVLSGYGYIDILSRRDILVRKTKAEVRSTGRTLGVSLEKVSLPEEKGHVQGLIDAVSEYERTLGVIVYYEEENLIFRSSFLKEGIEPYLNSIKRSIREDLSQEEFGVYKKVPIFCYAFPLKDKSGKSIGGVAILQRTSYMEGEIETAKWNIVIAIFVLIGGTVALLLAGTRRWVSQPISRLREGIMHMAQGDLDTRIDFKGHDELSELAHSFNQMAADLKIAQERIIRDAEARLELESGLRQSDKLATVGQLASGLAHEIGTPLNILLGRTELIKRRLEDKESTQRNLEIIDNQIERITKIIQQLLGFVRKKKPEQKVLDIGAVIEKTLDLLDYRIERQKLRIVKDFEQNLPPVAGDPDLLQQVFLNLILNALQSMSEGGTLSLHTSCTRISKGSFPESERHYVEVRVEDTGMGMEKEFIQNIFNAFYTTKETGTGLGLMVTQGIVQDHDGWIDVESEAGKGSVFKVYLPLFAGGEK